MTSLMPLLYFKRRSQGGSDPVRHHATHGDAHGHRPTSSFCRKNKGIITHLFRLLRDGDADLLRIFFSWIQGATGQPCD